jgi:hypothetical protein
MSPEKARMQAEPGQLSTLEIARSGFRLTLERPRLIALWALMSFVYNVLGSAFAAAVAGPSIARILAMVSQPNPDPSAAEPLLAQVAPAYAVLLTCGLALNAVYIAGAYRAVGASAGGRRGLVAFGRDALLQLGLLVVLTFIGLGVVLALLLVSTALSVVLAPTLVQFLGTLFALAGVGYVWLRFSLAAPAAYLTGRIDLAQAWRLTRGRLWALARIYLSVLALAGVVYLLGAVAIEKGLSAAFGGESKFGDLTQLDFSSPQALLTPARLALSALQACLSALILPVLLCPPIAIYRALTPVVAVQAPSLDGTSPWG